MRPWTLNPNDANADNPLLSELATYYISEGYEVGNARSSGLSLAPASLDIDSRQDGAVARTRITKKTPIRKQSYAATWEQYCQGNVISQINRRYIINLLAATCARTVEVPRDSSDDSEAENWSHLDLRAESIDVARRVLDGIAVQSSEEGQQTLGRYGGTIRLGRALWQSPAVTNNDKRGIDERFFDDGSVPAPDDLKTAAAKMKAAGEKRP